MVFIVVSCIWKFGSSKDEEKRDRNFREQMVEHDEGMRRVQNDERRRREEMEREFRLKEERMMEQSRTMVQQQAELQMKMRQAEHNKDMNRQQKGHWAYGQFLATFLFSLFFGSRCFFMFSERIKGRKNMRIRSPKSCHSFPLKNGVFFLLLVSVWASY